ncbi:acyl-CoA thioesterase [Novosphingobium piscinae]|uniref:Acyl-CoA thioesterase n=1 Tax=Novosphingobium piscinae TaxID=1507448 RepID=A0A7X1FYN9_9SPHN|nr:thioesterase family protein [Novosphingobium piscinae]MBC2669309.1 acyl-CoA thioesterase [Novosphingobium piscinae]
MPFETRVKVRFGDVDAAGIVFYPRYFEILNTAVEDWCEHVLEVDYRAMHVVQRWGIPVVDIAATFAAPSRLGDDLIVRIIPQSLGRSSCRLAAEFSCRGEKRLSMTLVVVCTDLTRMTSMPWPEHVRPRIEAGLAAGVPGGSPDEGSEKEPGL